MTIVTFAQDAEHGRIPRLHGFRTSLACALRNTWDPGAQFLPDKDAGTEQSAA